MDDKHHKAFVQIGLNILYYRKEKGITQQALAEMASFSRNHIQKIETAKATPSVAALIDIAEALNISVGKLFDPKS
ncbi:MAG: helix-turn-helix transcriptional regulator [Bacillota bacterium]